MGGSRKEVLLKALEALKKKGAFTTPPPIESLATLALAAQIGVVGQAIVDELEALRGVIGAAVDQNKKKSR